MGRLQTQCLVSILLSHPLLTSGEGLHPTLLLMLRTGPLEKATASSEKTRQIPTGPLGWIVSRLRPLSPSPLWGKKITIHNFSIDCQCPYRTFLDDHPPCSPRRRHLSCTLGSPSWTLCGDTQSLPEAKSGSGDDLAKLTHWDSITEG